MDIKQKFGLRIKELRKAKKLSQEKLANMADIDRTYLPTIEKGERNVSIEVVEKLAKALEVKINAGAANEEIFKDLNALHDTFHTIVGLCNPKEEHKDEHK